MARNIIPPTTANSTSSIANTFRMSIKLLGSSGAGLSGATHSRRGDAARRWFRRRAYIHPRITGDMVRYFEWMGAAVYTADRRAGAMHGKQFLLDAVHAGIDEAYIYGRLDFAENTVPAAEFELVVNLESWAADGLRPRRALRLDAGVASGSIRTWKISVPDTRSGSGQHRPDNRPSGGCPGPQF